MGVVRDDKTGVTQSCIIPAKGYKPSCQKGYQELLKGGSVSECVLVVCVLLSKATSTLGMRSGVHIQASSCSLVSLFAMMQCAFMAFC